MLIEKQEVVFFFRCQSYDWYHAFLQLLLSFYIWLLNTPHLLNVKFQTFKIYLKVLCSPRLLQCLPPSPTSQSWMARPVTHQPDRLLLIPVSRNFFLSSFPKHVHLPSYPPIVFTATSCTPYLKCLQYSSVSFSSSPGFISIECETLHAI